MTDAELQKRMKDYVMGWKETGEFLEAERRAKVRRANTANSLMNLGELFDSAVYLHPPSPTSGLLEFYEILGRSRK